MSSERQFAAEIASLRKEIFETRNLVIKTDNLLKTFHLELKEVGRNHAHTARRHLLSNVAAYSVIGVLGLAFALTYGAVLQRSAKHESEGALLKAQKLQAVADARMAAANKRAKEIEEANGDVTAVWELLTSDDAKKQEEGLARAATLNRNSLSSFARTVLDHTANGMREERASQAFSTGMAEQRAGNTRTAKEALERFLALAAQMPDDWRATDRLQATYHLGVLYNQLGEHDKAVPRLRLYVEKGESRSAKAYAYLLMGDSLDAQKHHDEAQKAYRAGLALEPSGMTASMLKRRLNEEPPT